MDQRPFELVNDDGCGLDSDPLLPISVAVVLVLLLASPHEIFNDGDARQGQHEKYKFLKGCVVRVHERIVSCF